MPPYRRTRTDRFFPVAEDFFAPVNLSESRLAALRREAAKALADALHSYDDYQSSRKTYLKHSPPWKLYARHEALRLFKRRHDTSPPTSVMHLVGAVEGNYLDLAAHFRTETRTDFFASHIKLHGATIDAHVLYNVPQPPPMKENGSDSSPITYEGIKWVASRPSSLQPRMDMCFYEAINTGFHASGEPYAYRVVIPARFPEVPDLYASKRTLRVFERSVMIIVPTEPNGTSSELFMTSLSDFRGYRLSRGVYKRYLATLHRINTTLYSQHLARQPPAAATAEPTNKCCAVCSKSFSILRSKHPCAMCHQNVCRKCLRKDHGSHLGDAFAVESSSRSKTERVVKVCAACVQAKLESCRAPSISRTATDSTRQGLLDSDPWIGDFTRPVPDSLDPSSSSMLSASPEYDEYSLRSTRYRLDSNCSVQSSCTLTSEPSPAGMFFVFPLEMPQPTTYSRLVTPDDRSSTVEIDTSEMKRVPSEPTLNTSFFSRPRGLSTGSSVSSEAFDTIQSSLQEQEILLQQLQLAYTSSGRGLRNTANTASDGAR